MPERKLVIINGESAAGLIRSVVDHADVLSWDDVLHDGPVPNLDLQSLSRVRADYIISCGWGESETSIYDRFRLRDEHVLGFQDYSEVVLVFEHDLYDQLQLCQLLHFFHTSGKEISSLSAVLTTDYIAEQDQTTIRTAWESRRNVSRSQLATGNSFWNIFTSRDHSALVDIDLSDIPAVGAARTRLLEEYPSVNSGLGRSRMMILEVLSEGKSDPVTVFKNYQVREEPRYLGDASFWKYIGELVDRPVPLVESMPTFFLPSSGTGFRSLTLSITDAGRRVFAGEEEDIKLNGIDHWIGGVHLTPSNIFRWTGSALIKG